MSSICQSVESFEVLTTSLLPVTFEMFPLSEVAISQIFGDLKGEKSLVNQQYRLGNSHPS